MVDVTVGQQDGGRSQPVLLKQGLQPGQHTDPRVDNDGILPRSGCEDVTVRREGGRREREGQHGTDTSDIA